ncbi:MAG: hypothetical protein LBE74_00765 [Treponema sp.]|jgi:hypothetical protein|nr:hypothetical protein [Treponema sp.]
MSDAAIEYERGLTFEKVWAMFQETGRQMKETDRMIKELREDSKETDRRMKETDRMIKELSRNIGGVNDTLGKWAEEMVSVRLWEKFNALGYDFTSATRNKKFLKGGQTIAEVDIFLENGEYAMPVEVKATLTTRDVDGHLKRLGLVREELDRRGDGRRLVGAVAGAVTPDDVRNYAQKRGLYVIVQSEDSTTIASAPEDFAPRVW